MDTDGSTTVTLWNPSARLVCYPILDFYDEDWIGVNLCPSVVKIRIGLLASETYFPLAHLTALMRRVLKGFMSWTRSSWPMVRPTTRDVGCEVIQTTG